MRAGVALRVPRCPWSAKRSRPHRTWRGAGQTYLIEEREGTNRIWSHFKGLLETMYSSYNSTNHVFSFLVFHCCPHYQTAPGKLQDVLVGTYLWQENPLDAVRYTYTMLFDVECFEEDTPEEFLLDSDKISSHDSRPCYKIRKMQEWRSRSWNHSPVLARLDSTQQLVLLTFPVISSESSFITFMINSTPPSTLASCSAFSSADTTRWKVKAINAVKMCKQIVL